MFAIRANTVGNDQPDLTNVDIAKKVPVANKPFVQRACITLRESQIRYGHASNKAEWSGFLKWGASIPLIASLFNSWPMSVGTGLLIAAAVGWLANMDAKEQIAKTAIEMGELEKQLREMQILVPPGRPQDYWYFRSFEPESMFDPFSDEAYG